MSSSHTNWHQFDQEWERCPPAVAVEVMGHMTSASKIFFKMMMTAHKVLVLDTQVYSNTEAGVYLRFLADLDMAQYGRCSWQVGNPKSA